jgi:hypothetical protein
VSGEGSEPSRGTPGSLSICSKHSAAWLHHRLTEPRGRCPSAAGSPAKRGSKFDRIQHRRRRKFRRLFFSRSSFCFFIENKGLHTRLAGKMVRDTDFSHYNSAIDIMPQINPPSMRSTSTLRPGRNRPGRIERPAQHFPPPNPRRRISKVWSRSLQLGQ